MDTEGFTAPPNCSLAPPLEKLHLLQTTERFISHQVIKAPGSQEAERRSTCGSKSRQEGATVLAS